MVEEIRLFGQIVHQCIRLATVAQCEMAHVCNILSGRTRAPYFTPRPKFPLVYLEIAQARELGGSESQSLFCYKTLKG